jgi:hypothetical protein
VLRGPHVKNRQRDFIDQRNGTAFDGKVHGFQIALAGIAALDADIRAFIGGVTRELFLVRFVAERAKHAAE